MLEDENNVLKIKIRMIPELEEKIEVTMRQKAELLAENQRMAKMIHQQRSEFEVLKKQFEMQNSQRHNLTTNLEFENKKLKN